LGARIADQQDAHVQFRYIDSSTETYLNRQIGGTGSVIDAGLSYRF
jgi:hypothetical protein